LNRGGKAGENTSLPAWIAMKDAQLFLRSVGDISTRRAVVNAAESDQSLPLAKPLFPKDCPSGECIDFSAPPGRNTNNPHVKGPTECAAIMAELKPLLAENS
jgi:hypothetical protein